MINKFFPKSLAFCDLNFDCSAKQLEKLINYRDSSNCLICNIPKFTINNSLIEFDNDILLYFKINYSKIPMSCLPVGYFDYLYRDSTYLVLKNTVITMDGKLLFHLKSDFDNNKCEIFLHSDILFQNNVVFSTFYEELKRFILSNTETDFKFNVFNKDIQVFSNPKLPVIYNIKNYINKLIIK